MQITKLALFSILLLLKRAVCQTVILHVGQLRGNVYVEWEGNLTALYQPEPFDEEGMQMFTGSNFLWVAFATTAYSYMAGSNSLVDYSFTQPGVFNVEPDMAMGDTIGFSSATTIYIPRNYQTGSPIEGCMLFEARSFLTLGILNGVTSSVSWEDPEGLEPTQSIVFETNADHFPPDYVTCFPSPVPSQAPSMLPTEMPTLSPTSSPVTSMAPVVQPEKDLGLVAGILVVIGAIAVSIIGLLLSDPDKGDVDSGDPSDSGDSGDSGSSKGKKRAGQGNRVRRVIQSRGA